VLKKKKNPRRTHYCPYTWKREREEGERKMGRLTISQRVKTPELYFFNSVENGFHIPEDEEGKL
jgi:hypothetical protein